MRLAEAGADVVVNYVTSKSAALETAEAIEQQETLLKQYGTPVTGKPGVYTFEDGTQTQFQEAWEPVVAHEIEVQATPLSAADFGTDCYLLPEEALLLGDLITD